MRKLPLILTPLIAVLVLAASINPAYVGKGDVQTLFEWNNATMQTNHESITFQYEASVVVSFDCEWWTGPAHNRTHHQVTEEAIFAVESFIDSNSRRTGQFTGWFLDWPEDLGVVDVDSYEPDCAGYGAGKTYVEGTLETADGMGGLYACFEGDCRLL
jgi:hypothetical protein